MNKIIKTKQGDECDIITDDCPETPVLTVHVMLYSLESEPSLYTTTILSLVSSQTPLTIETAAERIAVFAPRLPAHLQQHTVQSVLLDN